MGEMQLSERQQATVAAAITLVCAVVIVLFVFGIFWSFGYVIARFSSIILPLAVAGVLALVLKPYHRWLTLKLRRRRLLAVLLVYLSVLFPLGLFGYIFGTKVTAEVSELVQQIPVWVDAGRVKLDQHLPVVRDWWGHYGLGEKLKVGFDRHGEAILKGVGSAGEVALKAWSSLFRSITGLFGWVVLPIYLAFFLMAERPISRKQMEGLFPFLKQETKDDVIYLGQEFVNIIVAFFRGQIMVAFFQGLLFALGFIIIGLQYGFTLGLLLGLLNVIPYLGSMVGLAIALPLAFVQEGGGPLLVLYVIIVFTIVQCMEGYLLTPKIMGDRTGLHPLAIMIATFFWGSVFGGITGMILAIPLTAFLVVFWRLAKTKYIKAIV